MRGSVNWALNGYGKEETAMAAKVSNSRMASLRAMATDYSLHQMPETWASTTLRRSPLPYARFERTLTTNPIIAATKKKE